MNLGRIGIWGGAFDRLDAATLRRTAATLDDLGYSTLWLPETWLPETGGREAMTQAAMLLAATTWATIATGVAGIHRRTPATTGAAERTLREAYPGRFVLGLGVSHPALVDTWRPPIPAMREYLDALPPGPPRLVAAHGPRMLRLAATHAAGALPLGMPVAHTRAARDILGPDRILAVVQLVAYGDEPDLARTAVDQSMPNREHLLRDLGLDPAAPQTVDALVATGDTPNIAARVQDHLDAGADHVALHVLNPDPMPAWQALASALT